MSPRPTPWFAWMELDAPSPSRVRLHPGTPGRAPLPAAAWPGVVDALADAGVRAVQLGGARPLQHPAFGAVLDRAVARALEVEVDLGESWPLPDAAALDRFAAEGVRLVVALHSHLAPVHDRLADRAGSWGATLELLQAAGARGLEVRVAALADGRNAGHAPRVEALVRALDVLGTVRFDRPRGAGPGVPGWDPTRAAGACVLVDDAWFRHAHPLDEGPPPPTCWSGRVAVTADGALHPCPLARSVSLGRMDGGPLQGQLEANGARDLWALRTDQVPPCAGCDRKGTCFDCRALALAATGELLARRPNCDYQPPAERLHRPVPPRLRLAPHLAQARLGEEVLVLDVLQRSLHRMNGSAAWLLGRLGRGEGRPEVLASLLRTLPSGEADAVAGEDLEELAQVFHARGLLRAPGPEAPAPAREAVGGGGVPASPQVPQRCVLEVAGVRVALEASEAAWEGLAAWVLPLATPPAGPEPHRRLTVWTRGPAHRRLHHVLLDGHPLGRTVAPGLPWLVADALGKVVIEAPGAVAFHAAAVRGPAGAALLPGASGVGKSTLTLHAVAAGLGYLTDELAAVEPDGRRVRAFPRPVGIRADGLDLVPSALRHGLLDADPSDPKRWLVLPRARPAPLVALVVPDRRHPPGLSPLSPGDAAEVLVSQAFGLGAQVEPQGFLDQLVALAGRIPLWRLGTADLPDAARRLVDLLGGPADEPPVPATRRGVA